MADKTTPDNTGNKGATRHSKVLGPCDPRTLIRNEKIEIHVHTNCGDGNAKGTPDQKGEPAPAPKTPATDSSVKEAKGNGKSPEDCMDMIHKIQRTTLANARSVANHTIGVYERGFDKGKECGKCPDDKHRVETPVKSVQESTKWSAWDYIKMGLIVLGLLVILWLLLSQKGCNGLVPVAPTEAPCCLNEYKEGIRDGLEISQTRTPVYTNGEHESGQNDGPTADETLLTSDSDDTAPNYFGEYVPADPDLTLEILAYFTGPDSVNFRFYGSDSLDGENKFLLQALEMATLIASRKGVGWVERGGVKRWKVFPASYTPFNTVPEAGRMARLVGDKAKYNTSYQNEESFYWWVNSVVQAIPSSSETDWSRAVEETKARLMEKVRDERIPSSNGKVKFAVNYTPPPKRLANKSPPPKKKEAASRPSSASPKKSTGSASSGAKPKSKKLLSPLNMATASYVSLGYISPIPAGYRQISGGEFGVWRPEKGRYHYGEDLAPLVKGRKDRAVNPAPKIGTVISAKWETGYGKCVRLDVGDAVIIFAHLDSYGKGVQKGARIKQGGTIGNIGRTGGEYGVHLHIEFVPKVSNFIVPIFMKE